MALHSLGYIHHQLGAHETAVTCYRRAIVTYRHTSDDHSAANAEVVEEKIRSVA